MPDRIDVAEKFAQFSEHWRPKTLAELNGQEFKAVKIKGEFPWHHHDVDELFMVWRGEFRLEFRDRSVDLREGQLIVVRRGLSIGQWRMRKPRFSCSSRSERSTPATTSWTTSIRPQPGSKSSGNYPHRPGA